MAWVVAIIVLMLLVASAGFRKFALGLLGVLVVAGFGFYIHDEREERLSLSRISLSELKFEGLSLNPDYPAYKLTGRLTNYSPKYSLNSVKLSIKMNDCNASGPRSCVIIGESSAYIFKNIPPGQARELDEYVSFGGAPVSARGDLEWEYSLVEIKGSE